MRSARIVGDGRAGRALAGALAAVGWTVDGPLGRTAAVADAARGVDVLVIATPDNAIAEVAASVEPGDAVVVHLSGALGLDVLGTHPRRAALHPLAALPDADTGRQRLLGGCTFAVDGDPVATAIVADLGGRAVEVPDDRRALYHATAAIAANHLVALAGQVERLAVRVGVPVDAYWDLMAGALDNVRRLGAAAALTGPAARGDQATLDRHLAALPPEERPAYEAMSALAAKLAGRA
jgi:predicted short-subunit dehydrogenase-like oxidoreductase (DUF2520 family)